MLDPQVSVVDEANGEQGAAANDALMATAESVAKEEEEAEVVAKEAKAEEAEAAPDVNSLSVEEEDGRQLIGRCAERLGLGLGLGLGLEEVDGRQLIGRCAEMEGLPTDMHAHMHTQACMHACIQASGDRRADQIWPSQRDAV